MLFSLKRTLAGGLLSAALLTGLTWAGLMALDLPLPTGEIAWGWAVVGAGLMLGSDGVLHLVSQWTGRDGYRGRFRSLVDYFRGQGPFEIAAGSTLAASEEFFFRGLLYGVLTLKAGVPPLPSILFTAGAFGLAHFVPKPWGPPFALWAAWEGVLLGVVFLTSGSLATVALAHAIHDAVGFLVFARIRAKKTG